MTEPTRSRIETLNPFQRGMRVRTKPGVKPEVRHGVVTDVSVPNIVGVRADGRDLVFAASALVEDAETPPGR